MAKIKYSALVSDMRNKLNGSVMSANRYGSYVRNKVTPVNPQTSFQQNARAIFGALSSEWRSLTEAQRKSWNQGTKDFPFTDIFGDTKHLSGQSLFVKLNANLDYLGQPRALTAPSAVSFPDAGLDMPANFSWSNSSITLTTTADEADLNGFATALYVTDPVPPGVNFVKNRYRRMPNTMTFEGGLEGGDIAMTYDGITYTERFGAVPSGYSVYIRVAWASETSGQLGVPFEFVYTAP